MTTTTTDRKKAFIEQLAKFLVEGQAGKGMLLQVESMRPTTGMLATMPKLASEWAELRSKTNLFGYPTVEEAVVSLTELLS